MGGLDVLALIVTSIFVAIAFIGVTGSSADDRTATRGDLLRYAGVAALSGFASLLMYIGHVRGGGPISLAIANAAMAFTAAMLWASMRRVNGRGSGAVPTAAGTGIAVLGATLLIPVEANAVKLLAVTVFALLAGVACLRGRCRTLPGAKLIAAMAFPYAAFTVVRLVLALALGVDSAFFSTYLSTQVSTVVSVSAIAVVCLAIWAMGRGLDTEPSPASGPRMRKHRGAEAARMLRQHGGLVALSVSAPELDLIRAAFGTNRAGALARALERATAEALPGAVVGALSRDTVFALLPADADHHDVDGAVRSAFAEHAPRVSEGDPPELRIVHRGIGDIAQLSVFLGVNLAPQGATQPAAPEG